MNDFLSTGIIGILILLVTFLLFVTTVVVVIFGNRKALLVIALLGLLPLLLGVAGTALGYAATSQAVETLDVPPAELVQEGHRAARLTTWLGAGCALGLWVVALLGSLIIRKTRA